MSGFYKPSEESGGFFEKNGFLSTFPLANYLMLVYLSAPYE
jgi:hypothetical protein